MWMELLNALAQRCFSPRVLQTRVALPVAWTLRLPCLAAASRPFRRQAQSWHSRGSCGGRALLPASPLDLSPRQGQFRERRGCEPRPQWRGPVNFPTMRKDVVVGIRAGGRAARNVEYR